MGGRGASYNNYNGNFNIYVTDTFNKDEITDRNTRIVQKLKNRNVNVMKSTDNISDEVITPNLKQLDKILSKFKEYTGFENQNIYIRTEYFSNSNIQACFRCKEDKFERPEIIFNKTFEKKTIDKLEETSQKMIESNFWTDSDKYYYGSKVMSHEVGHYVQRVLTEQIAAKRGEKELREKNNTLYDKKISQEMFNKIDKICYDNFGEHAKTSVYGTKNEFEFFAETFCELVTKHNPSNTAKALDIYLKGERV